MKLVFTSLMLLLTLALCSCGSGSADTEADQEVAPDVIPDTESLPLDSYTPDTVPTSRKEAFDLMLKHKFNAQVLAIAGVYKVEVYGDISYYYIPKISGENGYSDFYLTAYNYLGDTTDNSADCFLPAKEGDINSYFNTGTGSDSIGAKIEYKNQFQTDSKLPEFTVRTTGGDLVIVVDDKTNKINRISYNSILAVNGEIIDPTNNVFISPVLDAEYDIDRILALQCKGISAKYAPLGFNGVYDTSLLLNGKKLENYLHIDESGVVTNWKYKGDGFGPSDTNNCYMRNDWYNKRLYGQKLLYNKEGNYLFANVSPFNVRWYLDADGKVISVGAPEPLQTFTIEELDVTVTAQLSNITTQDFELMECK